TGRVCLLGGVMWQRANEFIFEHAVAVTLGGMLIMLFAHFWTKKRSEMYPFIVACSGMIVVVLFAFYAVFAGKDTVSLRWIAVFVICYGVGLYIILCEALLLGLARRLTAWRGDKWVKEMDYFYLTLGALGIFGSLNKIE